MCIRDRSVSAPWNASLTTVGNGACVEVFDRCFWRDASAELMATFLLVTVQCFTHADRHTTLDVRTSFNDVQVNSSSHTSSPAAFHARPAASFRSELPVFKAVLANWLATTSLVWIFWKYGGAPMNPAVTLAFALTVRITFHRGVCCNAFFSITSDEVLLSTESHQLPEIKLSNGVASTQHFGRPKNYRAAVIRRPTNYRR